jgi:hypothetical protein
MERKSHCQACSNAKHGVRTRLRVDHTCEKARAGIASAIEEKANKKYPQSLCENSLFTSGQRLGYILGLSEVSEELATAREIIAEALIQLSHASQKPVNRGQQAPPTESAIQIINRIKAFLNGTK